jgi:hypothetical protein
MRSLAAFLDNHASADAGLLQSGRGQRRSSDPSTIRRASGSALSRTQPSSDKAGPLGSWRHSAGDLYVAVAAGGTKSQPHQSALVETVAETVSVEVIERPVAITEVEETRKAS